jgi:glycosyltransferase involved in cell wall biosynthesis
MEKPFFSVIIPAFNAAKYLDEAIESVIKQSFSNWELLIVDDGSTDSTYSKAILWTLKDPRIFVHQHDAGLNRGVSASRNLGLDEARGEWIAFLDADDLWKSDKLEKQHQIICKNDEQLVFVYNKAIIICDEEVSDSDSKISFNIKTKNIYGEGRPGLSVLPFVKIIGKGFEVSASTVVLKKTVLNNFRIRFKEHLTYSEDGLFWFEVIRHGNIYFLDEILSFYRIHSSQWNATATDNIKIGRRFLGYSEMLRSDITEYRNEISNLLINVGFRNIVRYYLSLGSLSPNKIIPYYQKVLSENLKFRYKFLALFVIGSELVILPLRWVRSLARKHVFSV